MVKFQGINCRQTCWRATCISSGGSASWCRWRKKSHLCIMEKENCLLKCSLLTKHIHRQNSFSLFILLCFHSSSSSDSELATKHYLKEKKKTSSTQNPSSSSQSHIIFHPGCFSTCSSCSLPLQSRPTDPSQNKKWEVYGAGCYCQGYSWWGACSMGRIFYMNWTEPYFWLGTMLIKIDKKNTVI